jgi:dipicolinate synthase subunit A
MGCRQATYEELHEVMRNSDIIFNTVPSLILDREVLKYANPDLLIIDLAAQPGGTDFEAANAYGLKAILAPGLPGKVAPLAAGKILADVIPRLLMAEISQREQELQFGS